MSKGLTDFTTDDYSTVDVTDDTAELLRKVEQDCGISPSELLETLVTAKAAYYLERDF